MLGSLGWIVGLYEVKIISPTGEVIATTRFMAPTEEEAEKVAKAGFESGAWKKATPDGYTETVRIT